MLNLTNENMTNKNIIQSERMFDTNKGGNSYGS